MEKVLFSFNGEVIHTANANELDTQSVVSYKSALAASQSLDSTLIEVEVI